MKTEIFRSLMAVLGVLAFIVLGAWYVSTPAHRSTIRIEQIKTDSAQTYPYQASAGRTWCVEQVE